MELAFQITAAAVIGAILCAVLRRDAPAYAYVLSIALCVGLTLACAALLEPVFQLLERLQELTGLGSALLAPVYKVIAIGALTQIAGGFCLDAGEEALARIVEMGGMILSLYTALPLLQAALELLQNMLRG